MWPVAVCVSSVKHIKLGKKQLILEENTVRLLVTPEVPVSDQEIIINVIIVYEPRGIWLFILISDWTENRKQ